MSGPANGKLSSRVMNMKFMRKAEQVEQEHQDVEEVKKLKNSLQWTLSSRSIPTTLVGRQSQRPVSLGATAIHSAISTATPVRRTFGAKPTAVADAAAASTSGTSSKLQELEPTNSHNDDQEKDLDQLFKESMKRKKSTGNKSSKKNKKAKKSK